MTGTGTGTSRNQWLRDDGSVAVGNVTNVDPVAGTGIDGQRRFVQWHGDPLPDYTQGQGSNIFAGTKPGVGVTEKPKEATTQDVYDLLKKVATKLQV
jgi:hypothetical protein